MDGVDVQHDRQQEIGKYVFTIKMRLLTQHYKNY